MPGKRMKLVGPPGTGKTTKLATWAQNLGSKYGYDDLMICSMTKTAAAEIGGRDTGVPRENVGTLHAICFRHMDKQTVWKPESHAGDFNDMFAGYDLSTTSSPEPGTEKSWGDELMSSLELMRAKMVPEENWSGDLREFAQKYKGFKSANGLIDFTDMIEHALAHTNSPFRYIIADEAQDYSRLEFELLKKWGDQSEGIVIAGDTDQSLYEFRGASVKEFVQFSDQRDVLSQSYRVPIKPWEYSEALVGRINYREERSYRPRQERGSLEYAEGIRSVEDVALYTEALLHDLGRHNSMGRRDVGQAPSVMVLTSCGYMTVKIAAALKSLGLPFHNPYRREGEYAGLWNPIAFGKKKVTAADRVRAFFAPPWSWGELNKWMSVMGDLPRGTKKELAEKKNIQQLVPLQWLRDRIGADGLAAAATGDLNWWLGKVLKTKVQPLEFPARVVKKHGIEGLTRRPQVIIGTVHSVKGGEADAVIVSPDLSRRFTQAWMYDNPDPILRMFFVAVTRTRDRLILMPHMNDRTRTFKWYV